jgi:hypothetical protein
VKQHQGENVADVCEADGLWRKPKVADWFTVLEDLIG